jgi:Helix-turn-helix domain
MFEIGNSLREARERQGRTFADLERKTQIRSRYLRALEEEQFSTLPGLAYTRGFLRVYADELGLDGQLYADEFNSRFSVSEEAREVYQSRQKRVPEHTQHSRRIAVSAVAVALATIAALAIVLVAFTSKTPQPKVPNLSQTTNQQATTLKFTAVHADTFVNIKIGGENGTLFFAGTLLKGRSKTVSGSTIWVNTNAIQNLSWTLPSGITADGQGRVGVATVLFSPSGHEFLKG